MVKNIVHIFVKILFYIFFVLLLFYLFVQTKQYGYYIFADEAKDSPETAKEMILTVEEGESIIDISKNLAEKEIVEHPYLFAITLRFSEGYEDIQPGEYIIQSSQKPSEILSVLTHKEDTQE